MNNKPKYHLFKNALYAIEGLKTAFKIETSFKIEMLLVPIDLVLIFYFDFLVTQKLILVVTMFLILIVELLNSAIENSVDLFTKEYNILAKQAKDIAATAVMFSIILHIICWGIIVYN